MKYIPILIAVCMIAGMLGTVEASESLVNTTLFKLTGNESFLVLTADKKFDVVIYTGNDTLTGTKGVIGNFSITDYSAYQKKRAAIEKHAAENNTQNMLLVEFFQKYPTPGLETVNLTGQIGTDNPIGLYGRIETIYGETVSEFLSVNNTRTMKTGKDFKADGDNGVLKKEGKTKRVDGTTKKVTIYWKVANA